MDFRPLGRCKTVEKIALSLTKLREQGDFRFNRRSEGSSVHAYRLAGRCELSATAHLDVPPGVFLLVVNVEGTVLMRCRTEKRWTIVSRGTLAFAATPRRLVASFGRGDHEIDLFWWSDSLTPQIAEWAKTECAERTHTVQYRSVAPVFNSIVERLNEGLAEPMPRQELLLLSCVYEMVPRLTDSTHGLHLAPLPPDLPKALRDIADQVTRNPKASWAIRDAATLAGYSPFHFSRVFKQHAGYGFHQFVDRCRTELAVNKLCNSHATIEDIARHCGFGTSHTLRDSIREYLGITPMELRTAAEEE